MERREPLSDLTMLCRLNANIGGRSQMSSIITSIFAIMTLFLLQYFHYLPKAVLASIVTVVSPAGLIVSRQTS